MFAHVRPTEFLESFFLIFTSDSVRQPNLIRLPFGEGGTAPVIAENVARMVRHAALHSAVARWQDLSLDRSATREHALLCTRAFEDGWTITFQDIPWWNRLLESGLAVPQLNHLATVADLHRAGRYEMSDDVLALRWQRPLSMPEFVRQASKLFEIRQTLTLLLPTR